MSLNNNSNGNTSNSVGPKMNKMETGEDFNCPMLRRYFSDTLRGISITPKESELQTILGELGINHDSLEHDLRLILPSMVLYYMKLWPGWRKNSEFSNGTMIFQEFFFAFKMYLLLKFNNLITNVYGTAKESYLKEVREKNEFRIAPFRIKVGGPAPIINNLSFLMKNNDIVITRNPRVCCKLLTFNHLLNWPCVEYTVMFPDMVFTRRNVNKIQRFLSRSDVKMLPKKSEVIVDSSIVDPNKAPLVVKTVTLKCYFNKYLEFVKLKYPHLHRDVEWRAIFYEFLEDIKHLNMEQTIATNTAVTFNIAQSLYITKEHVADSFSDHSSVKYWEVVSPRVEVTLKTFTAQPLATSASLMDFIIPCDNESNLDLPIVTYGCTYCAASFSCSSSMIYHLESEHDMEKMLSCLRCDKLFKVTELVYGRWEHECVSTVQID